jgi:hypothetical protein
MKRLLFVVNILLVFSLFLSSCASKSEVEKGISPTSTVEQEVATQVPAVEEDIEEDVLYLNLVWHQHQPLYYKNEDDVYTRPWVRVHATKDYYYMASILEQYP